jgi:hypothetical protein
VCLDHFDQVELPIPAQYVLINPHVTQVSEANLMVTHHDKVRSRITSHQE